MRAAACLLCFILHASTVGAIEKSEFYTIENIDRTESFDIQQDSTPYFAKKFRLPSGGGSRPAPKPKGQPPKQQPKGGGKDSPKGGHDNNRRESNRERHENADARRQKEQKKAEEKREQNKKDK